MEEFDIHVERCPQELIQTHADILTKDALQFIAELFQEFQQKIAVLRYLRKKQSLDLMNPSHFILPVPCKKIRSGNWVVDPPPDKLRSRYVDLGDVSPSNVAHLTAALNSKADGIQIDFDDGHCPSWQNEIIGHHNLFRVVHQTLPQVPPVKVAPALIVRPRAWNMSEFHMTVNGVPVPGPIFDFGLHMFHNGRLLYEAGIGPYFYLPKLQSPYETRLWNEIFVSCQQKLSIPRGTIKACVLIENILAAYQMEEMLYEIKEHSIGLNCGIWDYCASIICQFGRSKNFIIPDRNKYVDINRLFLKTMMNLTVSTCRKRGTFATSGMATSLMLDSKSTAMKVCEGKQKELRLGFHGFLLYDHNIVPYAKLFRDSLLNSTLDINFNIGTVDDLLLMPEGGVTEEGLKHNVTVSILFIFYWLEGRGHFEHSGSIEDSATAEISRWQVWQWLLHGVKMENTRERITLPLVRKICQEKVNKLGHLAVAANIFMEIVTLPEPPEYITTFLSNSYFLKDRSALITSNL